MEALIIHPTERHLAISLKPDTGKLSFNGRSLPEDSKAFFNPIIKWLQEYAKNPAPLTECSLKMEYFNSSSRKCFVDVFSVLNTIRKNGHAVTIIWNYEEDDDELKDMGEKYSSIYKDITFELHPY